MGGRFWTDHGNGLADMPRLPSFAQRDPFDLPQAGLVAKDRGDFTLAIRLFDEALQRDLFSEAI
ncbi:hypothetical protein JCM18382A_71650 [Bradyrhizobium sp. 17-4]|jgi:hypothetical protein